MSDKSDIGSISGEVISGYSRAQAIEDGALVDVSETALKMGIKFPVAVTRAVWCDCIEWSDEDSKRQIPQDETGRLRVVLTMLRCAATQDGEEVIFPVVRIPRDGKHMLPRCATLVAVCGPGDDAEPVVTVMQPGED